MSGYPSVCDIFAVNGYGLRRLEQGAVQYIYRNPCRFI